MVHWCILNSAWSLNWPNSFSWCMFMLIFIYKPYISEKTKKQTNKKKYFECFVHLFWMSSLNVLFDSEMSCGSKVGCNQHFMLILNVFFRCQPNIDPECILVLHGGVWIRSNKKLNLLLSSNISLSFCVCGERKKRLDKIKQERKKYEKFDPSSQSYILLVVPSPNPCKTPPLSILSHSPSDSV